MKIYYFRRARYYIYTQSDRNDGYVWYDKSCRWRKLVSWVPARSIIKKKEKKKKNEKEEMLRVYFEERQFLNYEGPRPGRDARSPYRKLEMQA